MPEPHQASRGAYGGHAERIEGYEPSSSIMTGVRTDGVLSRRIFAYLVDCVAIAVLVVLFAILIGISGIFTFGLTWVLYVILVPGTAILYSALSIGGPSMGTMGMRLMGLAALDASSGGRASPVLAGLHALLFYVGIGTFALFVLDVLIGLARADRRLGHDLLSDIIVVRR